MLIAIPLESHPAERRVAASPDSVKKLIHLGFSVAVETGAGVSACYTDAAFAAMGAQIISDPLQLYG
jgi:NAD(P) transhydrogenase subunit alpha